MGTWVGEVGALGGCELEFEFGDLYRVGDESGEEGGNGGGDENLRLGSVWFFHINMLDYLSLL